MTILHRVVSEYGIQHFYTNPCIIFVSTGAHYYCLRRFFTSGRLYKIDSLSPSGPVPVANAVIDALLRGNSAPNASNQRYEMHALTIPEGNFFGLGAN